MGLSGNTGSRSGKALPEAILPTAQEEPLKQNRRVLPETAQEERRSIPAAFSEVAEIHRKLAARRSKPSEGIALLAAAYLLGTFLAGGGSALRGRRCRNAFYYLNCWQNLFSVQDAAGAVRLFERNFSLWQVH